MGLLDSFEKGLERAVNGAFAKTFRSGVQPVEIVSALRGELDAEAAILSRDRILVPNILHVLLAPADHGRMAALGDSLRRELEDAVQQHARAQGYSFPGPLLLDIASDDRVPTGTVQVQSRSEEGRVSWQAVLEVDGTRHLVTSARTVIGRGSDADITLADTGTSRRHVEILWDGERAMVRDLGSTNGTVLDGRRIAEAPLPPDSTIKIGRTTIVFRVVARTQAARPTPSPASDATTVLDSRHWSGGA